MILFLAACTWSRVTLGALTEKDSLTAIKESVDVIRYLYKQLANVEKDLESVTLLREVTTRQLETERRLIEQEKAKGEKASQVKLAWYQRTLDKLQRDMDKLNKAQLEKLYGERIKQLQEQINYQRTELEAKIEEYRAHFGKEPPVKIEFGAEVPPRPGKTEVMLRFGM